MEKHHAGHRATHGDRLTGSRLGLSAESQSDFAQLLRFVLFHPLLFWSSLWVVLILIASVTVTRFLANPDFVANDESVHTIESTPPEQMPPVPLPPEQTAVTSADEGLPVWSFGAVAFSCAAGSLMISARLRRPQRSRKPTKRLPGTSPQTASGSPSPLPPQKTSDGAPDVSVVPVTESHPLDWGDASLADTVDIRRRRPLSF